MYGSGNSDYSPPFAAMLLYLAALLQGIGLGIGITLLILFLSASQSRGDEPPDFRTLEVRLDGIDPPEDSTRPRIEVARGWEVLEAAHKFNRPFIAWVDCYPSDTPALTKLFDGLGDVTHATIRDEPGLTGQGSGPRLVWHDKAGQRWYYPVSRVKGTEAGKVLKSLWAGDAPPERNPAEPAEVGPTYPGFVPGCIPKLRR